MQFVNLNVEFMIYKIRLRIQGIKDYSTCSLVILLTTRKLIACLHHIFHSRLKKQSLPSYAETETQLNDFYKHFNLKVYYYCIIGGLQLVGFCLVLILLVLKCK